MGYENRDYFRDGSYLGRGGGFLDDAPMCKRILIVTVVVFLIQMFWTRPATESDYKQYVDRMHQHVDKLSDDYLDDGTFSDDDSYIADSAIGLNLPHVSVAEQWLKLDTDKVIKGGQVWRLITCAFCHDRMGVWHILINMLLLYWFGRFVESTYGSKEFLLFYLAAALVASLAFIGLELAVGERFGAIGASGAVMAVFCLFALWNPTHTIRINFLFPIQVQYLLWIYVIYEVHPVLLRLSGTQVFSGVGHAAHLGGLMFGFLYFKNSWQLSPWSNKLASVFGSNSNSKRRVRSSGDSEKILPFPDSAVSERSEAPVKEKTRADLRFDEQVDDILRKISERGQESLTDRERKILNLGSQRYKER